MPDRDWHKQTGADMPEVRRVLAGRLLEGSSGRARGQRGAVVLRGVVVLPRDATATMRSSKPAFELDM